MARPKSNFEVHDSNQDAKTITQDISNQNDHVEPMKTDQEIQAELEKLIQKDGEDFLNGDMTDPATEAAKEKDKKEHLEKLAQNQAKDGKAKEGKKLSPEDEKKKLAEKKKQDEKNKKEAEDKKKKENEELLAQYNQQAIPEENVTGLEDSEKKQLQSDFTGSPGLPNRNNSSPNVSAPATPQLAQNRNNEQQNRFEYWRDQIQQNPDMNQASSLLVDFKSGKIKESDFIQIIKELVTSSSKEKNSVGVFLLSAHASIASFEVLVVDASKVHESLKTQVIGLINDYGNGSQIQILNQILKAKNKLTFPVALNVAQKAIHSFSRSLASIPRPSSNSGINAIEGSETRPNREVRGSASSGASFGEQNRQMNQFHITSLNQTLKEIKNSGGLQDYTTQIDELIQMSSL